MFMQPVFKHHSVHQQVLFPLNLNDLISENHSSRLIDSVVEKLEISEIISQYKGGGTSSYHPKMLLKILFYGYLNNTYSCRKIAKAVKENIYFMWLSGGLQPDFRTINDFRGQKLKGNIEKLFSQLVIMMVDLELVSLEKQFIDGTKIEANAHKYSFVWKKSVEKNKERLQSKIDVVLAEIGQAIESDLMHTDNQIDTKIDSQKLEEKIQAINKNSKSDFLNKKQKKVVQKLENEQLPKLKEYEQHLEILGSRNSYSKTDTDATFMRMKEDHMLNGQLKPAYNIQISTENQIITHYSTHQTSTDFTTLETHLEGFKDAYQKQSNQVIADAGYGSEENYQLLEKKEVEFFIPYNMYRIEQTLKHKKNLFHTQNLFYNQEHDFLVCPIGQKMSKIYTKKSETTTGFIQYHSVYQAINCEGCPMRGQCFKAQGNRKIEINHNLQKLKTKARENLESELGKEIYSKRCIEPEPVFGNIKQNKGFKRFTLNKINKVNIEFGLVAIAHNFSKWIAKVSSENYKPIFTLTNQLNNCLGQFLMLDLEHARNY
ncbi:transposase, IS4 family [Flavobacterium xanthum]|uniref:Transposase, IS4 family n=2 Tax=Flavobacterium xanthum TaxID=69322 RepID=A0A1M7LCX2_9FLAO|nr:transposase, IS4 family [Flavobacterium xanthum]